MDIGSDTFRDIVWEGDTYRLTPFAPFGKRVLIKVGDKFVSKPGLDELFVTIDFNGKLVSPTA